MGYSEKNVPANYLYEAIKNMLLSLIIPVYKVDKYIEECLESVCSQLITDMSLEVILVNDGSPDDSMKIAKKYISENYYNHLSKFIFIDQDNQGLSGARNTGIDNAQGEYLMFLDSDDKIEKNFFNKILSILDKNIIDIVQFKAYRFYDNSDKKLNFIIDSQYEGQHKIDDVILDSIFNAANWFSWLRIYHKRMFSNIRFPVGELYEDAYTTPFIFLNAESVYFINECLIGYRYNDHGITAKITDKTLNDLKGVSECFALNISQNYHFGLSVISISQYYITQSLKYEGWLKAKNRWYELKKIIDTSNFDENNLKNRGNRLFYKFGILFLIFEQVAIKLKVRK